MDEPASDQIREFFDRQQVDDSYESLKLMTRELDIDAAHRLNAIVRGDTLSVGGIWDFFSWSDELRTLTVLDVSPEMLKAYCPATATGIIGDYYKHEFTRHSFDTIVFPLMLHHVAQGNWRSCEGRIVQAIEIAQTLLRPDGQVIILEYCPQFASSYLQRALLPLTRRFLARFNQPLVVMHNRAFYQKVLAERFGTSDAYRVDPEGFNYWKWYPIFMSIRWLRIPLALYPRLYVINAPAAG